MNTDIVSEVKRLVNKKIELTERLFDWQLLEEERLEAKLQLFLKQAKDKSLEKFDELFTDEAKKKIKGDIKFLSKVVLEPKLTFKQLGEFRYKQHTLPVKIREWFSKSPSDFSPNAINVVSAINPDPFTNVLDDSVFRAYGAGGQSAFHTFDIGVDFSLRDLNTEKWFKNYELQLANAISTEISSKIKFGILEGIKNAESIPEIRNRILDAWSKPIDVVVAPKLDVDGNIIRQGYQYQLKAEHWANTVARTEVSRAFAAGRLEAYDQMKVVKKVEWMVTPDERLCPICASYEGEQYTLDQAFGLIPAHGNCRCTWIPILTDDDFDKARAEAKDNVEKLYSQPIREAETARKIRPEETKLSSDSIKSKKELGGGVNGTYLTSDGVKGVFKPIDGEALDLRDSIKAGTYYKREVASYKVDRILGTDLVPPTVIRTVEGNVGSHQLFMEGYEIAISAPSSWLKAVPQAEKNRMTFLDYILAHEDRHKANWMINSRGKIVAIDNGLALGDFAYYPRYAFEEAISVTDVGIKKLYDNFSWRKVELLKKELYDSGLIGEEAFTGVLGRIRALVLNEKVDLTSGIYTKQGTNYYRTLGTSFENIMKDLKSVFKKAGKL